MKGSKELDREGFIIVIVPDFILKTLRESQRRVLPAWEETKDNPAHGPIGNSLLKCFPYEEMELYRATMDEESISFVRKWLKDGRRAYSGRLPHRPISRSHRRRNRIR